MPRYKKNYIDLTLINSGNTEILDKNTDHVICLTGKQKPLYSLEKKITKWFGEFHVQYDKMWQLSKKTFVISNHICGNLWKWKKCENLTFKSTFILAPTAADCNRKKSKVILFQEIWRKCRLLSLLWGQNWRQEIMQLIDILSCLTNYAFKRYDCQSVKYKLNMPSSSDLQEWTVSLNSELEVMIPKLLKQIINKQVLLLAMY